MVYGYEPLEATDSFNELRAELLGRLDKSPRPLLITIDGHPGAGKTSLCELLGLQLNLAAIHLDDFLVGKGKLEWLPDLKASLDELMRSERSVILEGAGVDMALDQFSTHPDFTIFVTNLSYLVAPMRVLRNYFDERDRASKADFHLTWSS